MKKFVKLLSLALVFILTLSMMAGCSSARSEENELAFSKKKVAFATNAVGENFLEMQKAYDEVIGPALNIEFMYSEALSDAGAMITFIENAYASGCDGVICSLSNSIDQAAAKCEELGMYFIGINSAGARENQAMDHYVAVTGASAEGYGESYAEALKDAVADGRSHSVLILSGAASMGATSFIEGTAGSLRALQDVYGLTYTMGIDELATSSTQTDAENDKGIKITIVPGMADLANLVSPLLQTGSYDVLVGTTDVFRSLSVAVDEVEKELNMNIIFVNRSTPSDTISKAFHTNDSTGNVSMDAIVAQGTYEYIASAVALRNVFDGYASNMRDNGQCSRIPGMRPLVIVSPEQYDIVSGENVPYSYVTVEEILNLCGKDVTWKDINAFGESLTTEVIMKKFG